VRRGDVPTSLAAQFPVAEVIGEQYDDIGLVGRIACAGPENGQ
jgi:hypothetical protein